MKAKFDSDFNYGTKISKYLLIATIISALVSVLFTPAGGVAQVALVTFTTILIIINFRIIYKYCRCPFCGKHIMMGALRVKVCPACNRNLQTGKKTKKYER